jgi:hypothetical protein
LQLFCVLCLSFLHQLIVSSFDRGVVWCGVVWCGVMCCRVG